MRARQSVFAIEGSGAAVSTIWLNSENSARGIVAVVESIVWCLPASPKVSDDGVSRNQNGVIEG
jgi:hypothetical protein